MDLTPLFGFAAISLTLALTPGADWAYTIAAGLRPGSPAPSVAGLCAGYVVHTALVAAGLGMLLAARPDLVAWLSVAGALYLLWLGFTTARGWRAAGFTAAPAASLPSGEPLDAAVRPRGAVRDFLLGLGTSGINPKALLLFAAVMPQFIRPESPLPVVAQTTAMGLTHLGFTVVVYSLVAVGARRLLAARPRRAQTVTLVSGVLMLVIGGALLAEQAVALAGGWIA
ncbi:lysine transporter LysE [Sinomonas cyclohexanicum]|uniref:Lysine transporter LysE n=1 Tax=Sinomonas cyclohexanicum TaxID=322009 RepID=A0ABM7PXJ5_SINCY|nr:LysE family translocator [Corynebacterium cyclohexanicum]BCT76843.1 lysine transporter LysE [Corynebacterium cyclohexanicum]